MSTLGQLWGPFGLSVRCGPVELRAVTDADLPALIDLVLGGIHDPQRMPFKHPWTDAAPEDLARDTAAYFWDNRSTFRPEHWTLDLAVRHEERLVGVQSVTTKDYLVVRTGETGSWLARKHQGQGIGTTMRQAMCGLLFDHLGADELTSGAFTDNPASFAVSRKLGYVDNGTVRIQRRPGELAVNRKLLLTRELFNRSNHPLHVTGADGLRAAIGLAPDGG